MRFAIASGTDIINENTVHVEKLLVVITLDDDQGAKQGQFAITTSSTGSITFDTSGNSELPLVPSEDGFSIEDSFRIVRTVSAFLALAKTQLESISSVLSLTNNIANSTLLGMDKDYTLRTYSQLFNDLTNRPFNAIWFLNENTNTFILATEGNFIPSGITLTEADQVDDYPMIDIDGKKLRDNILAIGKFDQFTENVTVSNPLALGTETLIIRDNTLLDAGSVTKFAVNTGIRAASLIEVVVFKLDPHSTGFQDYTGIQKGSTVIVKLPTAASAYQVDATLLVYGLWTERGGGDKEILTVILIKRL